MAEIERPLSPHLQIYRWQITSVLSILHRLTGLALGLGALALAWWLIAAAMGPGAYATVQGFFGSILGRVILLGFTYSLFYHLCNGIRHLAWDLGLGLDIPTVTRSGWAAVVASVALTLLAWSLGYAWRVS
jgi:succinate dehydrogenase / fumarate reductase cytochrome b subunit